MKGLYFIFLLLLLFGCRGRERKTFDANVDAKVDAKAKDRKVGDVVEEKTDTKPPLYREIGAPCEKREHCGPVGKAHCITEETYKWKDGYCIRFCESREENPCPEGSACVLRISLSDYGCFKKCTPNPDDNDVCRYGYSCGPFRDVCTRGCNPQAETNECCEVCTEFDPEITTCYKWETIKEGCEDVVRCNEKTFECDNEGVPGVSVGDPCIGDFECQKEGNCIPEILFRGEWRGGYCTRFGCNYEWEPCPEPSVCSYQEISILEINVWMCLKPCLLGVDQGNGTFDGGCREGYSCYPDHTGKGSYRGVCFSGNFNEKSAPNIGEDCMGEEIEEPHSECFSPYGLGRCIGKWLRGQFAFKDGYCTILCGDVDAEGEKWEYPSEFGDLCGEEGACVSFWLYPDKMMCMKRCDPEASDSGCKEDEVCYPGELLGHPEVKGVCIFRCLYDSDCPPEKTCDKEKGLCT